MLGPPERQSPAAVSAANGAVKINLAERLINSENRLSPKHLQRIVLARRFGLPALRGIDHRRSFLRRGADAMSGAEVQESVAVYSGQLYRGEITPLGSGQFEALDHDGTRIGLFENRRAAEQAILRSITTVAS